MQNCLPYFTQGNYCQTAMILYSTRSISAKDQQAASAVLGSSSLISFLGLSGAAPFSRQSPFRFSRVGRRPGNWKTQHLVSFTGYY